MMRKTVSLVLVLAILAIAPVAYAETTLLATEELRVNLGDDPKTAAEKIVGAAIAKAKLHPCVIKAESENRAINIKMKMSLVVGEDYFVSILELSSDEC